MSKKLNDKNSSNTFFDNSLWDIETASRKLSISEATLRDWVYKKKIPFIKIRSLVRFVPSDLQKWIEERS